MFRYTSPSAHKTQLLCLKQILDKGSEIHLPQHKCLGYLLGVDATLVESRRKRHVNANINCIRLISPNQCDQAKPACSRCARLDLECSGAGVQRYKFKLVGHPDVLSLERADHVREILPLRTTSPSHHPQNDLDLLIHDFTRAIEPRTDIRYNLLWTYGAYMADIPKRLGTNTALDSSVRALTTLHSSYCSRTQILSPQGLSEYTNALSCLRKCLEDPTVARTAETLCAVSILVICQSFLGESGDQDGSHTRGAAQVLKIRGYFDSQDSFETSLLLALRGPVV